MTSPSICVGHDHDTFVDSQPGTKARLKCRRCKLSLTAVYCPTNKAHFWFNPPWLPARTAANCHHCVSDVPTTC